MKRRHRSNSTENARAARTSSGWPLLLAATVIVLAAVVAYSNSLQGPFIFDDQQNIVDNASIRRLWPIWSVFFLQGSGRAALHGRPVMNLSLALDYAAGGLDPYYYRLTNLLIHVLAGLTLFGIVRRTLLLPSLGQRFAAAATLLALAVALIWTLHPLDTAAVTYVVQRYESLMGLFYLLALYAAIRCGTSAHPRRWAVAAVAATLLALGCKEVAVSIPLCILLYDRAFLAGSFRAALGRRWGMYVGLASAWAAFVVLFLCSYNRGAWAGYGLRVSWMEYARTQFGVILHYLRLAFWPCPLVLDYGWPVARTVGEILPGAVVIGGLAAATAYALVRWPKWGFLGAWFFMILAPTSSIMPLADLAFEHRMYLPLAALVTGVMVGGCLVGQWLVRRGTISSPTSQAIGAALVICASITFGILTFQRNADYQSDLSIWQDTMAKVPGNVRAHYNVGIALGDRKRFDEAFVQFRQAVEINPDSAEAHYNLGVALDRYRQQMDEAIVHYERAVELKPEYVQAQHNLGRALAARGRVDEAIAHYEKALELKPDYFAAHYNLGTILAGRGRIDEAIAHYRHALEIKPDLALAHNSLGLALAGRGQLDEAIAHYQKALAIEPNDADARRNLANALKQKGRVK